MLNGLHVQSVAVHSGPLSLKRNVPLMETPEKKKKKAKWFFGGFAVCLE